MELRQVFKNKNNGDFVLSQDNAHTICAYSFIQNTPVNEWIVNHNNSSTVISVQVYVNDILIIPDEIIIINENKFKVKFTTNVVGRLNFLVYKNGNKCGIAEITPEPTITPTPTPSVTPSIT